MSYLLPQLWLCLSLATLLGGAIGWFLRDNKGQKLTEIENRWHRRFSDLEYTNQSLLGQLKNSKNLELKHKKLLARLEHMEKAARLSNQELKNRKVSLSKLNSKLKQSKYVNSDPTQVTEIESVHEALMNKVDRYKANLIDAQSKLQVAYEILEAQGLPMNTQSTPTR